MNTQGTNYNMVNMMKMPMQPNTYNQQYIRPTTTMNNTMPNNYNQQYNMNNQGMMMNNNYKPPGYQQQPPQNYQGFQQQQQPMQNYQGYQQQQPMPIQNNFALQNTPPRTSQSQAQLPLGEEQQTHLSRRASPMRTYSPRRRCSPCHSPHRRCSPHHSPCRSNSPLRCHSPHRCCTLCHCNPCNAVHYVIAIHVNVVHYAIVIHVNVVIYVIATHVGVVNSHLQMAQIHFYHTSKR
jgi:hypothetical protein